MSNQPAAPASKADLTSSSSGVSGTVTSIWNGKGVTYITVGPSGQWLLLDSAIQSGPSMAEAALVKGLQVYAALESDGSTIYGLAIYAP
jgi:hypothetical protein